MPSRVAAAAGHRRSSPPLLAQARLICSSGSPSQLTVAPRPGSPNRFVPGLGYDFHAPPIVSPPLISFSRGAARLPCEARHRARLPCAALHRARSAQRARRRPAPCTGSPTNDIHSAGTPRGTPPALLPSTPSERRPLFQRRSKSHCHAPPTHFLQPARLASPRPRLRLAGLSRPQAHRATRAARQRLAPSIL
jgi:hypothetical protein